MFENLQNLGWGLVGFALIIGIGSVVLNRFGGAVADCPSLCYNYNSTAIWNVSLATCSHPENSSIAYGAPTAWTWNSTLDKCANASGGNATTPASAGWTNTNYLIGELGSSGLAGWTPAIIAIAVGMLIFGAFMIRRKGRAY